MSTSVREVHVPSRPDLAPPGEVPASSRWRRLVRGRASDPAWVRPSVLLLLLGTAGLYLWGLGASGWANAFYSAAVQAGTKSWKAMFFGSFDAANFITVDKPPAALWVMDLSARLFGVNAWSILVPQALEGVAAVGLLYAAVRRAFSPAAGLVAGAVLALTPVAVLMFRFNNPDALLTLLLVAAAYAVVRAVERAGTRWLVLAGVLVGLAFLTKMLQALLVLPAFAFVYLLAAPASLWRRVRQLLAAGLAMIVSAGWWVAAVTLWPASARPYIGGSQTNSVLELVFGYNGFGRITGSETGSVGGGRAGSAWGPTGWLRMFNSQFGGQISWLIPAALLGLGAVVWLSRRAPRTDGARAQTLLWGGWLAVTAVVLSLAKGIIHPYYTVVLGPAIGALVGAGGVTLWRHRHAPAARLALAAGVAGTAAWAFALLGRSPGWHPWLRVAVLVAGLGVAVVLVASRLSRRSVAAAVAGVSILAALAGPAASTLATAATPHTGAIPSAAPTVTDGLGTRGRGGVGGPGGAGFPGTLPGAGNQGFPPRGAPPAGGPPSRRPQGGPGGIQGGLGGLLDASRPSSAIVQLLLANHTAYTWVAAAVGANSAAGVQLATDQPVLAIGGFNGSDPSPTLVQFLALVRQGRIHYFLGGSGFGGPGGSTGTSSQIASWVSQHFTAQTVGGVTLYDLTQAAAG